MITQLREIYIKKGKEFIDKLFSLEVLVNEKYSGSFFAFERKQDGLHFYRRDSELTKIERIVSRLYECPIRYLE